MLSNLRAAVAFPKMLAFRTPNYIFTPPKSTGITFAKICATENSHCNPKIVGHNMSSEQIFKETVCWVPLNNRESLSMRHVENGTFIPAEQVGSFRLLWSARKAKTRTRKSVKQSRKANGLSIPRRSLDPPRN